MRAFSLVHLTNHELLSGLARLVIQHRATTAAMLAHIAEVDARRLYAPAGYPSMYSYCVVELKLSEDAAFKRIHVARVARRFPAIFEALEEGRLNLTSVRMLAPYLSAHNVDDLAAAAAHKSNKEVQGLLADRYPRSEVLGLVEGPLPAEDAVASLGDPIAIDSGNEQAARPVATPESESSGEQAARPVAVPESESSGEQAARPVATSALESQDPTTRSFVKPHAPGRYTLHLNLSRETYEKLLHVQALLSHQIPSADIAEAIHRALEHFVRQLEKNKFAATSRPRLGTQPADAGSTTPAGRSRYIPSHVMRAVWKRDAGQCTFVGSNGQRCPARSFIEFDHIEPVARGGRATVDGIRLRCRAHNQYEAEQAFGAEFMEGKRRPAAASRGATAEEGQADEGGPAAAGRR